MATQTIQTQGEEATGITLDVGLAQDLGSKFIESNLAKQYTESGLAVDPNKPDPNADPNPNPNNDPDPNKPDPDKKPENADPNPDPNAAPENKPDGESEITDDEIKAKVKEILEKKEEERSTLEKEFIDEYGKAGGDTSDPDDIVNKLKSHYTESIGIDFGEETFTNDVEGFTKLSTEVGKVIAATVVQNHFSSNPLYSKFYEHTSNGGTLDSFREINSEPTFKSIKLKQVTDDLNESERESAISGARKMIELDFKSKGFSDAQISAFVNSVEDKGYDDLFQQAKASETNLTKDHNDRVEAVKKAQEEEVKRQEEADAAYLTSIRDAVENNNFGGFQIPQNTKGNFLKALTIADATGKTVIDKKYEALSVDKQLLLDYMVLTDFKDLKLQPVSKSENFTFSKLLNGDRKFGALFSASDSGKGGQGAGGSKIKTLSELKVNNIDFSKIEHK